MSCLTTLSLDKIDLRRWYLNEWVLRDGRGLLGGESDKMGENPLPLPSPAGI